jgi:hypothetical protein
MMGGVRRSAPSKQYPSGKKFGVHLQIESFNIFVIPKRTTTIIRSCFSTVSLNISMAMIASAQENEVHTHKQNCIHYYYQIQIPIDYCKNSYCVPAFIDPGNHDDILRGEGYEIRYRCSRSSPWIILL